MIDLWILIFPQERRTRFAIENIFLKTNMERMGSRKAGERGDNVHDEPHLISSDNNTFRGSPKSGFETKISSSVSPVIRLSKDHQLSEQKATNSMRLGSHLQKKTIGNGVRKKNKIPNIKLNMAEVKSNIERRKEHKGLSTLVPGRRNFMNSYRSSLNVKERVEGIVTYDTQISLVIPDQKVILRKKSDVLWPKDIN